MTHYRTNLADIEFNLLRMVPYWAAAVDSSSGQAHTQDPPTLRSLLQETDRFARNVLAASFSAADRHPPTLDRATGRIHLPEEIKDTYRQLTQCGYHRLGLSARLGGQPLPASTHWALMELLVGANPALWMYTAGTLFADLLDQEGTPQQRRWAKLMLERDWTATMALTEPDAGSDIGSLRTRATLQPDGSWHLEGNKRFISGGDHDLTENILHFVLARPTGTPGAGGPGTKGLSLFVVPAQLFDEPDGSPRQPNGVRVTSLASKLGLHASATCEIAFGAAGQPARGWLLGNVHDGIRQMFKIVTQVRMVVGVKAAATLSTGYLNALAYARTRIQGADLRAAGDPAAPRVPILCHPEIRRSLLLQKATAEGLRALIAYTATWQDIAACTSDPQLRAQAGSTAAFLLPIVKGYASERCSELLANESMQVLGGSGYLTDYPLEQYLRDSRIDSIYEGTTAMQAFDLLFRQMVRDHGHTACTLIAHVRAAASRPGPHTLEHTRLRLGAAATDVEAITKELLTLLNSGQTDENAPYQAALHARRTLLAFGDLLTGWLLLEQATQASSASTTGLPHDPQAFRNGKTACAHFFATEVLPRLSADRTTVGYADLVPIRLAENAF